MKNIILRALLVGCLIVPAGCTADDDEETPQKKKDSGYQGSSGSGGDQEEDAAGGQSGEEEDAGDAAVEPDLGCPEGLLCTAPGGSFVCTLAETGIPPTCDDDSDCEFGKCTEYMGVKFCTQSCGPAVKKECPGASVCNTLFDGATLCAESIIWSAPPCDTDDDCPFGKCLLSYNSQKLCIQPCESTIVSECPNDTACVPLSGKYFCAPPLFGVPDSCSPRNDNCSYGTCVEYLGEQDGYCTQECIPDFVDKCPSGTSCRFLMPVGFFCSEKSTLIPPECDTQDDCEFGTCIKFGEDSYCTEYCAQPGIEIIGTILGLTAPVEGVKVCLFEDGEEVEDSCTETNADGQFALLGLPEEPVFVLSMSKEGYQSNLELAFANQLTTSLMFTEDEIRDVADAIDISYPEEDTGLIVFSALGVNPVSGFTAELTPDSGDGPYYANTNNDIDDSLEEASAIGWGAFYNVPAGTYALDLNHDSLVCSDLPEVTVESGYLTYVVTYCL
ncbi:MAG: carboxypeptidase regulatory-like domain-containing protein [Deltaproteobacteria bacterium]|nr:carboxypeptidase regulatory-like domain-containing protein [Deltaproteobacteria bacterium]